MRIPRLTILKIVDHIDPSIFCVLTAPSRDPSAPLTDFLIFSPRWDVASHTYRPPYYHRNAASELMGLIYGEYAGRSDEFKPGGVSFECGFVPHGVGKLNSHESLGCVDPKPDALAGDHDTCTDCATV